MKKKLVASLAAAMVLGVAGTSFAATNPFSDVPAKHWSYDAVTKLAKAGIVDGYSDGTFKGDKVISRYEMAQMVAKAMAHSDKATAEQKAAIDKLSVEFASELEGLNVRVTKLEKNSSSIKVSGEARLRWEDFASSSVSSSATKNTGSDFALRTRVNLNGNINDDWSYYGRLQSFSNLRGDGAGEGKGNNVTLDNAYVKGPIAGATMTAGRFDYFLNNGLMIDSTLNGAQFEFGNVLKAKVFYGNENHNDILFADHYVRTLGLAMNYAVTKDTNINGGYYQFKNNNSTIYDIGTKDTAKVWEVGFNTKLAADWGLQASYGKSDATDQNKAYFAQLDYKGADKTKAGTFGAWVGYRHLDVDASPETTFDGPYAFNSQRNGAKGYEIGLAYAPMNNSLLKLKYADLKSTLNSAGDAKSKYYLAQMEFFF
jgi:hypothetical protein